MTAEISAPKFKGSGRERRPLTRKDMGHQRYVQRIRPDGTRQVGQLVSRPAADDEFARWLITPAAYGSVTWQRIDWADVEAGQFFGAGPDELTEEQQRTLARSLRRYLNGD